MTEPRDSSLYKKYRPTQFSYLIGPAKHNGETLRRMLASGEDMPHNFLFCGDSGTGKTTTARILARALNCQDLQDGNPCMKCPPCRLHSTQIADEVNAANARGIDDVREKIMDMAYSPPAPLKYSVTILDEAGVMTKDAMNALLVPTEDDNHYPHVFTIFCTTEPNKIIKTLLSRLLKFEFGPPPFVEIVKLLKDVLYWHGVKGYSEYVVKAIADTAKGNVRSALTELDKVLASGAISDDRKADLVLSETEEAPEDIRKIPRLIMRGSLQELKQSLLSSTKDYEPEKIRMVVAGYFRTATLGDQDTEGTGRFLKVLMRFQEPLYSNGGSSRDMLNKIVGMCIAAWYDMRT